MESEVFWECRLKNVRLKIERAVGMSDVHKGQCFCGAVQLEVSGSPEATGYWHCESCRSWSTAPVNAFTLWKPDSVMITMGAEHVGMFQKTELSQRQYCQKWGGRLIRDPHLRSNPLQ